MGQLERFLLIMGPNLPHISGRIIGLRLTSIYTPSSNPVETRMRIRGDCLCLHCPTRHRSWYWFRAEIESRLNCVEYSTTKFPPITLMEKVWIDYDGDLLSLTDTEYEQILQTARENTKKVLEQRRLQFEKQQNYNLGTSPSCVCSYLHQV